MREVTFFMGSLFQSTSNTRSILPGSFRFLRSDVPDNLSNQEIQWLLDHNITTIVDLRTEAERRKKPCSLAENSRFQYYSMPVSGGNQIPASVEDVSKSYIQMADARMDEIIDLIWNSKSNVLYFCNAGKDRTGVVSAILLCRAGMPVNYIVEDYMESRENLKAQLNSFAERFPQVPLEVITPKQRYIQEFLTWFLAN